MNKPSILSDRDLLEVNIKNSKYLSEVLRKMGLNPVGGGVYKTLNKYIKLYNLDISHFNKNGFQKGHTIRKKYEFSEIFIENFKGHIGSSGLKKRLYKLNLKNPKCEICGINDIWNGFKIPMILDHINGINNDNRLENLRIICHNCDATLPTYKGRNKINKKEKTIDNNKEKKLLEIKDKIIKSNIDFSKKTWGVEVAKLIDKSPQWSLQFVKENLPHLIIKNKKTETRK